ncbi:MAG: aromatic ring-hydroxylating oxygenase subunit alpha [Acetobacteraceae bacterium]
MNEAAVRQLLRTRTPGFSLPQPFYTDPAIFTLDLRAIFERQWIFAGLASEIAEPGAYLTVEVGTSSVLVLRDRGGEVRAFFNTCRHRGARICDDRHGRAKTLVCPYHRWTYRLSGALASAPFMPEGFARERYSLKPLAVRELCGTIFVTLAADPPDFAPYAEALAPHLAPHGLDQAKVAFECDLIEEGNWKLVMENSRECYHCRTQHRELMRTFLDIYDFAAPGDQAEIEQYWARLRAMGLPTHIVDGPEFRATRLPFTHGALSITMDGTPAVSRRLGSVPSNDIGSLRWVHYPSVFNHALGDYAVMVRMLPDAPQRSVVTTKFLVHRDAVEGRDYDVKRLTEVWLATNDQDKALVERNQAGVNSAGYEPGPYSPALEAGVIKFVNWYAGELAAYLDAGTLRAAAE